MNDDWSDNLSKKDNPVPSNEKIVILSLLTSDVLDQKMTAR